MATGNLTPKQQAFVREYLLDLNATAAARRAGYKDGNKGRQLVTKSNIAAAIQEAIQARGARAEIKADWVLEHLRYEATLEGKGSSPAARVKALELLGKHLGMFVDRLSIEPPRRTRVVVEVVHASDPAPDRNGTARSADA